MKTSVQAAENKILEMLTKCVKTLGFFMFPLLSNLVPRASFPLTSGRKTRALGATISGMRHRCRCAVSRITRIQLFPLFFQNGCSQSSRFLPQARRIVGSGDENACSLVTFAHVHCATNAQ